MVNARTVCLGMFVFGFYFMPGSARAIDCSSLPTSFAGNEFPSGDFFSNFNNSCYTIRLGQGYGATEYGDRNAVYYQTYFKVDPRYQLILVGTFPNTRYFSVSLYDAHSALSGSILDTKIAPLTSQYINPYLPGVSYIDGQQYAIPINFGGTPGIQESGCLMNGYNVDGNKLDATLRHTGMDWNSDAGVFQQYPKIADHIVDTAIHTNPNTAGVLMIRAYLNDTPSSYSTNPHIIVRDVASGCAYPADYALNTLQIVTTSTGTGGAWLDHPQTGAHTTYETSYLPKLCNASTAPPNRLQWLRPAEYIPGTNPDAAYTTASVPSGLPDTLAAAGEVMRIRLRVPTVPPTPCTDGCTRSGNEQMRYMSLSFLIPGGSTIASVADTAFTKDPNGYATLIVGTGAAIPSWITPANGYTYLDLTSLTGYQQLNLLDLRHIIPGPGFDCAGQFVPYRMSVDTPAGSLMGDYEPVVDYPVAATLPQTVSPLVRASACGSFPVGQAGVRPNCGVLSAPPPSISAVMTECHAPGCTQFVAQSKPPVTIVGDGFGVFPEGLPFKGNSNYLRITNTTRNWSAGYTASPCTVSISSWDANRIQFVANIPRSGQCQIAKGDGITVEVWNPQSMISASFETLAQSN